MPTAISTDSLTSYAALDAYLGRKTDRPAPKGNAMRIVRGHLGADTISVIYHRTPIVTYRADGSVLLWANGWATRTTAAHMVEYLPDSLAVRGEPVRYGEGSRKIATVRGFDYYNADRQGHGTSLLLWQEDGTPRDFSQHDVAEFRADGTFLPRAFGYGFTLTKPMAEYDCTCKMCRVGASSWQSAQFA